MLFLCGLAASFEFFRRAAVKESATQMESSGFKVVVGLGNPGEKYIHTRHNMGFKVIDSVARMLKTDVRKRKFSARLGQAEFANKKLILLKPWQMMNCSGQAVEQAVSFYRVAMSDLLVVTDDMALPLGRIRLRPNGSAGGHNGLADIIEKLGADEFARCRIGIGGCDDVDAVDFVLAEPTKQDKMLLDKAVDRAVEAVLCWVENGIETAMNRFNSA